ncbi:PQQ-binding-like beta-propeller repeat protein [Streptomyces sp. NPDC013953]|uniref:outer membrane protein assembly factor BamB family protein n=1 Tax=Streptomyces sp. NPDC013953 TaxID=3364868 RepID=UPI0036FDC08A
MSVSPARALAIGFFALAASTLPLSACDGSRSADNPPTRETQPEKPLYEISQHPVWTAPTTGERYCHRYVNGTVTDAGSSDLTLRDAVTGKTKWSYKKATSCPLVTKESVYVGTAAEDEIIALDPLTGKQTASSKADTFGSPEGGAPVETPGKIHALFDGFLHTMDKSLKQNIWQYGEKADMWVDHVAAHGATIVVATQNGKVKALSSEDGKVLWTYATPSNGLIKQTIKIMDGSVYFTSKDGSAYALDLITGKKIWVTELGGGPAWAPHPAGDLLITADEWTVYGLDRKTGKTRWSHWDDHNALLASEDLAVYSDTEADQVTVRNATTGELITTISPLPGANSIAISPTHLFVWTDTGIHAYKVTKRATA